MDPIVEASTTQERKRSQKIIKLIRTLLGKTDILAENAKLVATTGELGRYPQDGARRSELEQTNDQFIHCISRYRRSVLNQGAIDLPLRYHCAHVREAIITENIRRLAAKTTYQFDRGIMYAECHRVRCRVNDIVRLTAR